MPVKRATLEHLVEIRALLRHARRAYSDFGLEDLPDLLGRGTAVVGISDGEMWGTACVVVEDRPATLPRAAPTRAHLRCIAVKQGYSPAPAVNDLITTLVDTLTANHTATHTGPLLMVSYGMYDWVCQGLSRNGFDLVDTVEFFQIDDLEKHLAQRPPPTPDLVLHPAEPELFGQLAALDATAFPPLWHFGERDLVELCMRCRVQVAYHTADAEQAHEPVGYSAVCYNSREEAQLARLAVAPGYQGRGIGRALLWDSIQDAAATQHKILVLNTQSNNHRSQRLYLGMGFRSMGETLPVLGRLLNR